MDQLYIIIVKDWKWILYGFLGVQGSFNWKYDFIIYSLNDFGNFKKEVGEKC